MIIEEIKNIKTGRGEFRKFGMTVGVVLGLLGGLFFIHEKGYYSYFLILSITFLFLGLFLPIILKPIHKIWMTLAILMGWLMTRLILGLLFYLVVTPIGLLARLFGEDFLDLKFNRNANSYWISKKVTEFERKRYENQF